MKRGRKFMLAVLAALIVLVGAYAAWTRFRSPETAAQADSYRVWIALLKSFDGPVEYVGSDDLHAYFRVGFIFSSYYKVPTCAVQLPDTFSVGDGRSYIVRFHLQTDGSIRSVSSCSIQNGHTIGELEKV